MNYRYNSPNLVGLLKVAGNGFAMNDWSGINWGGAFGGTDSTPSGKKDSKPAPVAQSAPAPKPAPKPAPVVQPPPSASPAVPVPGRENVAAPGPNEFPTVTVDGGIGEAAAPMEPVDFKMRDLVARKAVNSAVKGLASAVNNTAPVVKNIASGFNSLVKQLPQTPGIPNEQILGEAELNWQPTPASTPAPAVSAPTAAQVDYSKIFGKNFNPGTSKADAWLQAQAEKLRKQNYSDAQISTMLSPSAYRRFGRKGQDYVVDTKRYRRPLGR